MSNDSVKAFLVELAQDSELQQEFSALVEGGDPADGIAAGAVVTFASAKGYEFTAEELRDAGGELEDAELESVAGGVWNLSVRRRRGGDRPTEDVAINFSKL